MLQFPGIESDKAFCFTEKEINEEKEKIIKTANVPLSDLITEMRIYLFKDLGLTVRKDYLDENFDIKIKEMNFKLYLLSYVLIFSRLSNSYAYLLCIKTKASI